MKTLHKLLSAILICAIATSCSTTQKIQVFGTSGTQIYSPGKTKLATIDYSGKAQIELDSDAYYAYLLAKSDGSDDYVPFALDYKNYSYAGSKFALGLGYALAGTGAGTAAIGTIAMAATAINGDDDLTETFGLISAAGLGLGLVGVAIGMPADQCLSQIDHDYQFKYLKNQTTNEDLSLYFTLLSTSKCKIKKYF